jgi:hypothetical protein
MVQNAGVVLLSGTSSIVKVRKVQIIQRTEEQKNKEEFSRHGILRI